MDTGKQNIAAIKLLTEEGDYSMEEEMKCFKKKKKSKSTIVSLLVIFIIIPFTFFVAWNFGNRNYYLLNTVIIAYTIIPFFMAFEKRKPQAKEMVLLAVMCGIAVVSRVAFIWVPHFKPIIAIIIITGIALGAEAGFLTGVMSAFVSDFIFGMGQWTPWQMFAFGIAGFLAGFFVEKGVLKKERFPVCIFGGLVVILLVGPILDTSTFFIMSSAISTSSALAVYLSGLPVNTILATATVITLFLSLNPMLEKIDRVKLKYGMMEE